MVLCLLPLLVQAHESNELHNLLGRAAVAQSNAYVEVRAEIVTLGTNALPQLAKASSNPGLPWQERLTARICYERIKRRNDIDALRNYDWRKNKDFNIDWSRSMAGPGWKMQDLVVTWLVEQGLWYYYIGLIWKSTREQSLVNIHRINENWNGWCILALREQAEESYLWLAIEDRLDRDDNMQAHEARNLYNYIKKTNQTNCIPLLIRKYDAFFKVQATGLESYPGENVELYRRFFTPILSIANSSHADMLEKYIDERPDLAVLKPKLEEVRARPSHTPPREPPFRLGTTPVTIP